MARNYSEEIQNEVKNMMLSGKSDTEISKIISISTNTIRRWRKNFGFSPSSGGNNKYTDDVKNRCYDLMKKDKTNKEISEIVGISTTTIAKWRKGAGITNSTRSKGSKKYTEEIKQEALALMEDGLSNSEVSKLLGVNRKAVGYWRKKAGMKPSSGAKVRYTVDQINDVIDLIREGNTMADISRISGVNRVKIKEIREEEVRTGNPLPELIKGVSRTQKYSDEQLIELVYLNRGYGLKRFTELLGVSTNFFFDLSLDFKDFTEGKEDLVAILQDESYGQMVSRNEYYEITGNERAPKGTGSSNGGRTPKPDRLGVKGRILKDVYLPPQNFDWGNVEPKVWRNQKRKELVWIEERIEQKGYISSIADKKQFIEETGAGKTKFNQWMNKAGLVFDKKSNRWYRTY